MTDVYTVTWALNEQVGAFATTGEEEREQKIREMVGQGAVVFTNINHYTGPLAQPEQTLIVLLDLNYTLVGNSRETFNIQNPKIDEEIYRAWLVELIKDHHVILVTTRSETLAEKTLLRIKRQTDWRPDGAFFKPEADKFQKAEVFKEGVLKKILSEYGMDTRQYVALESNANTREMYTTYNVFSVPVPRDKAWPALPKIQHLHGGYKLALLKREDKEAHYDSDQTGVL